MTQYIIFDLETTGLSCTRDRIVSIAAIDLYSGDEFYAEINPLMRLQKAAAAVNGFSDEMLQGKPTWAQVGPAFWQWIGDHQSSGGSLCFVAHNGRRFDIPMLTNELKRLAALPPAKGPLFVADTLTISRQLFPHLVSKKLSSVFEHMFKKQPDKQHHALGDAQALLQLVKHPLFKDKVEDPLFSVRIIDL